jgi:hypothetical protein
MASKLLLSKYGTLILVSKWANPLTFKIQIRLHLAIYFELHGGNIR